MNRLDVKALLLLSGLALSLSMQTSAAGPQVPQQRGDAMRTGQSPYECPRSPKLSWTYSTSGCSATPVVGQDGIVYFGALDKYQYAVRRDGTTAWKYQSNGVVKASSGIGSDGSIYFSTAMGSLYALQADGTSKWGSPIGSGGQSTVGSVMIGLAGTVYFASENKNVYAVSPDGSVLWSYGMAAKPKFGLASSPTGSVIYSPGDDGCVYAINSNGTLKWKSTNVTANNICAVGSDGVVYVGGTDYKLYALNPNGTVKWTCTTYGKVASGAAVGFDGTIYVGSADRRLYAIRPDGTVKWVYTAQDIVYSAPTVDAFGTVVFGVATGDVIALNTADGSVIWNYRLNSSIYTSPVVAKDGYVYVMDSDGKLNAFTGPVAAIPDLPEPASVVAVAFAIGAWGLTSRRRPTKAA